MKERILKPLIVATEKVVDYYYQDDKEKQNLEVSSLGVNAEAVRDC
jgi:hypothetical protein